MGDHDEAMPFIRSVNRNPLQPDTVIHMAAFPEYAGWKEDNKAVENKVSIATCGDGEQGWSRAG